MLPCSLSFLRTYEPLLNPQHPEHEAYSPNLHQIWDTEIVERDMEVCNPHRYADELDGKRMFEKDLVADEAYQIRAAKAVETDLAEAGVRLAMILNDAAKANP